MRKPDRRIAEPVVTALARFCDFARATRAGCG